jgi:hypothetical protein
MSMSRGPMTHVYTTCQYLSGRRTFNVLFREDIEAIRQMSKKPNGPAWTKREEEMWKKCAIKVHSKELDMTPKLARAIELDNREYIMDAPVVPRNNSGFGRGQYADDNRVSETEKVLRDFADSVNTRWLDAWTGVDGAIDPAIRKPLINVWQLDNHLIKWACETGRLDESSMDVGRKGLCLYTAILWFRQNDAGEFADREAMKLEMNAYQKVLWKRTTQAVKAKHAEMANENTREPYKEPPREPGDDEDGLPDDFEG